MSSVRTAPEPHFFPVNETKWLKQPATATFWSPQVACALFLVLTDMAAMALSLKTAVFLRIHLLPQPDSHFTNRAFSFWHYMAIFGWMGPMLVACLSVEGLYTQRRSLWNEIGHLMKAVGFSVAAILAAVELTQTDPVISRSTIPLTTIMLLILLPGVRYGAKWSLGKLGLWRKRILILGAAQTARLAMHGLSSDPVLGYEVAGLLDDDPLKINQCFGSCGGRLALVLGTLSEAGQQMARLDAKDALIAMPGLPEEKLLALVHQLQPYCENIFVVPRLWGLPMMNLQVDGFLRERVMMLKLSNNLAKPWNGWLKRALDLGLGTFLALLAFPLGLLIAVLIKIDSEGPALFVQERMGYRGRNFRCIKFRTMFLGGDERLALYLERNAHAAEEWRTYAKLRGFDPRLTRLGRFLRRWSLDELPQLWNVLKGEMSLIGPRPYLPRESSRIGVNLSTILSARPGLTGFWQVNGRNHVSLDERVQVEAWYVRNWTVWLDCIVLAKTFEAVLFPENGVGPVEAQEVGGCRGPYSSR